MKTNRFGITLIMTGALTLLLSPGYGQESRLDPEVQYAQDRLKEAQEQSGYADAEIDELHRRIGEILPQLDGIVKEENGVRKVRLVITSGQSYRLTGEHYIVSGYADVYLRNDNTLEKVVLIYERLNAVGNAYVAERRELNNPTPNYYEDGSIDTNNDLILVYSEKHQPGDDFEEVAEINFSDIDRHRNRTQILRTYKQYLRKTITALDTMLRNKETRQRARIKYMLEFE